MTFVVARAGRGRVRASVALVIGFVLLIAGCGVSTDPTRAVPDRWVDPPAISLAAQQHFTQPQIESAFAIVTQFAFEHGYDPALMDPQNEAYTKEQLLAGVVGSLTPTLGERVAQRVEAALAGSADDQDGLRVLQFYGWEQPDWRLPEDGKPVRSQWIRNAEVGATEATDIPALRLKITLIHQATVRYAEPLGEFELDVAKRVSYWMLPQNEDATEWLIDEYEGVFAVDEDLPVEESNQATLPAPTSTPGIPAAPEPPPIDDEVAAGQLPAQNRSAASRAPVAPVEADAPPQNPVVRDGASAPRKIAVADAPPTGAGGPAAPAPPPAGAPALAARQPVAPPVAVPPAPPLAPPPPMAPPTTRPADPPRTSQPPRTTQPPQTTQPPRTTRPPRTTQPPQTTQPPRTTQPPQSTQPPRTTRPPRTTQPPRTTRPPRTQPPRTTRPPRTTQPPRATQPPRTRPTRTNGPPRNERDERARGNDGQQPGNGRRPSLPPQAQGRGPTR